MGTRDIISDINQLKADLANVQSGKLEKGEKKKRVKTKEEKGGKRKKEGVEKRVKSNREKRKNRKAKINRCM